MEIRVSDLGVRLIDDWTHIFAGLSVWRLHHDLVAVASAIGLHCYDPCNPHKDPGALTETWHLTNPKDRGKVGVTLRTEIRKRLSASCFWSDKELAMFTGRPPAWSHRYHSCPLPYDVSDEALIEGGERLKQELSELDENGWNTKGEIHGKSTIMCYRSLPGLLLMTGQILRPRAQWF
jgi:hypothetical protein